MSTLSGGDPKSNWVEHGQSYRVRDANKKVGKKQTDGNQEQNGIDEFDLDSLFNIDLLHNIFIIRSDSTFCAFFLNLLKSLMVTSEKASPGDFGSSKSGTLSLRELMSKAKRVQTENLIGSHEFRNRRDPPVNLWQQYVSKNDDSDDFKLMNF